MGAGGWGFVMPNPNCRNPNPLLDYALRMGGCNGSNSNGRLVCQLRPEHLINIAGLAAEHSRVGRAEAAGVEDAADLVDFMMHGAAASAGWKTHGKFIEDAEQIAGHVDIVASLTPDLCKR